MQKNINNYDYQRTLPPSVRVDICSPLITSAAPRLSEIQIKLRSPLSLSLSVFAITFVFVFVFVCLCSPIILRRRRYQIKSPLSLLAFGCISFLNLHFRLSTFFQYFIESYALQIAKNKLHLGFDGEVKG